MRFILFWAFIGISLIIIMRSPFWGVVIYSCMNIIRPELLFWGGKCYSIDSMKVIFFAIIIGIIIHRKETSWCNIYQKELFLLYLLYAGTIVSNLLSQYNLPHQYYYANELLIVAFFCSFVCLLVNSQVKIASYQNYLLLFVVILASWGIDQHFRGNDRLELLGGYDSNGAAAFFVLFAPLAFHKYVVAKTRRGKSAWAAASISIVLAIIFSQSRGGLLGLIAATLVYILFSKKKVQVLIVAFMISLIAWPFLADTYTERIMGTMTSEEKLDWSAESRLYLWQAGLMIFRDNPFFGTGLLSYPIEKFKYEDHFSYLDPEFRAWLFRGNDPKVTHNTYIKFLSDCGLAAGAPYVLLIIGTFLANRKVRQRMNAGELCDKKMMALLIAVECGIWGNCVSNFFIDANFEIFLYIQIICCAIMRGLLYDNKRLSSSKSGKTIFVGQLDANTF